ncbi:unnamed protein product [Jaminaea pallidilutea]
MKLLLTFVLAALLINASVLAEVTKRCAECEKLKHEHEQEQHGGGGNGNGGDNTDGGDGFGNNDGQHHHPANEDATQQACNSSVFAFLIGVSALNCADINILSSKTVIKERGLGSFADHYDPVFEDMKKRAGVKGMCEDPKLSSLQRDGLLDCKKKVFKADPGYKAEPEACQTQTVGLLAALSLLNCADINILSNEVVIHKDHKGDNDGHGSNTDGFNNGNGSGSGGGSGSGSGSGGNGNGEDCHEDERSLRRSINEGSFNTNPVLVDLMRRSIASRACERANEELGVRMLDCHSPDLTKRLLGGLGGGSGSGKSTEKSSGSSEVESEACNTSTVAALIGVSALNCPDINLLSNSVVIDKSDDGDNNTEDVHETRGESEGHVKTFGRRHQIIKKRRASSQVA